MKSMIVFLMNGGSCLCLLWVFYVFYKVRHMMKSNAWVIIHASFLILFVKWVFDAWVLYGAAANPYTIIHEILTLSFAIGITFGFTIFCDDFATARRWNIKFKNSSDKNKVLSSELVDDLLDANERREQNENKSSGDKSH